MRSAATPSRRLHDLSWRRRDAFVLIVLCTLAWCALAPAVLTRSAGVHPGSAPSPRRLRLAAERIDPNTAGAASLRRLPTIGPARASAIVAFRRGPPARVFSCPDDLARIPGIGPGTVETVTPYLKRLPPP